MDKNQSVHCYILEIDPFADDKESKLITLIHKVHEIRKMGEWTPEQPNFLPIDLVSMDLRKPKQSEVYFSVQSETGMAVSAKGGQHEVFHKVDNLATVYSTSKLQIQTLEDY